MLAALLLVGIVSAPLSSAALCVSTPRPGRFAGTRRLAYALVGTAVLAAVLAGALYLLGVSRTNLAVGVAAFVGMSLAWLPATRRWNARGHLCWVSSVFLFAAYLVFVLNWTFASYLGVWSTAGGLLLWALEAFAAVLACAYLWELCDALGTERWRRRVTATTPAPAVPERRLPFVSLQVPAHNEPPDMVIETLSSLLRIDYPRCEVIAVDDNSEDEQLWRPVEDWCARKVPSTAPSGVGSSTAPGTEPSATSEPTGTATSTSRPITRPTGPSTPTPSSSG